MTCRRGHDKPPGARCPTCRAERQAEEKVRLHEMAKAVAATAGPVDPAKQEWIAALIQTSRHADAA